VTRAALYCRISSDRDDTQLGVERQEKDLRTLCKERGWTVSGTYIDNNISAASGALRPEYQRMLRDIERGAVDAIATWDLDRLTRRPIELEEFVATCDKAGVTQIAFVGGGVDMGTGDGLLVARIKGAVAAEEVRKTRERIKRKKLEIAEKGESHGGGTRPFGFEDDRITVVEPEAELIREAASRILSGASLYAICHDWNDRGLRTVTRKPWYVTGLRTALIRPRTAGLRQHQGEVIGDAVWPAILERETWEQVRAILTDPSRRQPAASRPYPLNGVIRCGECGRYLSAMPRKNGRNYGCRKEAGGCGHVYVSADLVEKEVFHTVLQCADSPTLRSLVANEEQDVAQEARALVIENAADEKMLTQLDADYADRVIPRTTYLKQSQRLRDRIDARQSQLATLRGRSALDRLGGHVSEQWNEMSPDDKRSVVLTFMNSVDVMRATRKCGNKFDRDRIVIDWRFNSLARASFDGFDDLNEDDQNEATRRFKRGWDTGEKLYADRKRRGAAAAKKS